MGFSKMKKMTRHDKLLKKFLEYGLNAFEQNEILELLLSFTLPEEEARLKSDELMYRLGSATAIMDMNIEGLIRVGKLSEKSAVLLNLVPKVLRRYCVDNMNVSKMRFDDLISLGEYCTAKYIGTTDEVLSMVLINEKAGLDGFEIIQVGSLASASVNIEKIAEILFAYNSPYFVLVHNHPDANVVPSEEDMEVTDWIREQFSYLGKTLLEHIIVYNNRFMPVLKYMELEDEKRAQEFVQCFLGNRFS
jgi:DNA repair protein RadC